MITYTTTHRGTRITVSSTSDLPQVVTIVRSCGLELSDMEQVGDHILVRCAPRTAQIVERRLSRRLDALRWG